MPKVYIFAILSILAQFTFAQAPQKYNSAEIFKSIQKLNFLGSVLYVAAHPDDENTQLISYLENDQNARTAYISLTRGDGGQNLIGSELGGLLGVIRTQELLAARRIDGGEQFFSRANDFGYSKTPEETFSIWNKEEVLKDLVYVIREFQPDIIINRFDHRTSGTTHGHHTASAMLSLEAFQDANDPSKFSDQLRHFSVWQPSKLFFNTSWWFYGSQEKFEKADKSNLVKLDIGSYYPSLGLSNSEIAANSRSQHKSQGFGITATLGESVEFLEIIKGEKPEKKLFEGIDTSWNRLERGNKIAEILLKLEKQFDFENPSASVAGLMQAYAFIQNLEDTHWRTYKSEEIKKIIGACLGLYLEVVAPSTTAVRNENLDLTLNAINRSNVAVTLQKVQFPDGSEKSIGHALASNKNVALNVNYPIASDANFTTPYWLKEKGSLGLYKVEDSNLTGLPEAPNENIVRFFININGQTLDFVRPIVFKTNDPVEGEVYKTFAVVPKVAVSVQDKVMLFDDLTPKKVRVNVKAYKENISGKLRLESDQNWKVTPDSQVVNMAQKGEVKVYEFLVTPPNSSEETALLPRLTVDGENFSQELIEIQYDHIPTQFVLQSGEGKVVKLDIQKKGDNIGYIVGAGDEVPESLRQIGYKVSLLNAADITLESISKYDAIVLGIRAFNTVEELKFKNKLLFEYVQNGGNLIVQYNTNRGLVTDEIAPYELKLGRERVTDENSELRFVHTKTAVMNYPNSLSEKDFEGWVQERGLYFPEKWGKEFQTAIAMHDKGEPYLDSGILVAKYGKGNYVYTGLSFFRQLPAGVPGAYRLFANLVSLGKY